MKHLLKGLMVLLCLTTFSIGRSYAQDDPEPDSIIIVTSNPDSIVYQSPENVVVDANAVVRFASNATAYVKWSAVTGATGYVLRYKLVNGETWSVVQTSANELILRNLPLDQNYTFVVGVVGGTSPFGYQSEVGLFSTFPQTEPIRVSPRLYNDLSGWFTQGTNAVPFCESFIQSNVNLYEKLAFIQAYAFNNEPFLDAGTSPTLSSWYPLTYTGPRTEGACIPSFGEENCRCKVVSRGSNIARPFGSMDYPNAKVKPKIVQKIEKDPGDKTFVDRFEAGAAKFVSLRQDEGAGGMNFSISSLPGDDDGDAPTAEASEIQFFLACMTSNGGYTTNLPADCQCERPLHVAYEYTTNLFVKAAKKSCPFSKGAAAQAEDMAFVAKLNVKTGEFTALDAGHAMVGRGCSSSWNPNFWIQVINVLIPVANYYIATQDNNNNNDVPTSNQIQQFAQALQTLIGTPFSNNTGSCGNVESDTVLVSGHHTFNLKPNEPIRISLFSGFYLRTRGYGCYRAQAAVASDYYLMGVVESQLLPHDRECCADKFANYIAGSLSAPPEGDVQIQAQNSIDVRLAQVGFELSAYGSWDGLTIAPNSGIILLEGKEFSLLNGPSCQLEGNNQKGTTSTISSDLAGSPKVTLYPSIISDFLNIDIDVQYPSFSQIRLINANGRVSKELYMGKLDTGSHALRLPVNDVAKGSYIVQCLVKDKNYKYKVLIL